MRTAVVLRGKLERMGLGALVARLGRKTTDLLYRYPHGSRANESPVGPRPLPVPESNRFEKLMRVYGRMRCEARIVYFFIITLESI